MEGGKEKERPKRPATHRNGTQGLDKGSLDVVSSEQEAGNDGEDERHDPPRQAWKRGTRTRHAVSCSHGCGCGGCKY